MLNLLIVDDEYYTCEGLKVAIDWQKYGVTQIDIARDGSEALEFIENHRVDILITDIRMKMLDGLDMIKILRERGFNGQIIVLSGYSYFEYAQKAIDYGIRRYLLKPIDFNELEETISKISGELLKESGEKAIKIGKSTYMIKNVLDYVNEHFCEDIQLSAIAEKNYCDVTYLSKLFKEYVGINYSEYLTSKRMEKVEKLLLTTGESIEEIALAAGYNDMAHFRKIFKRYAGMSPGEFKKRNMKERH